MAPPPLVWLWPRPGGVVGILTALMGCGTINIGVDTVGGEDEEAEPLLRA